MKYNIWHHIIFPVAVNDNCLAAGQGSPEPSFGRINTVRKPGPSQSAIARIFAAVRAEIERGYNDI